MFNVPPFHHLIRCELYCAIIDSIVIYEQNNVHFSSFHVSDMAGEHFRAKDIGLKAQRKLLSRMSTKTTVKLFIDDQSASVLDNTYKLFKKYVSRKKLSLEPRWFSSHVLSLYRFKIIAETCLCVFLSENFVDTSAT